MKKLKDEEKGLVKARHVSHMDDVIIYSSFSGQKGRWGSQTGCAGLQVNMHLAIGRPACSRLKSPHCTEIIIGVMEVVLHDRTSGATQPGRDLQQQQRGCLWHRSMARLSRIVFS